MDRCFTTLGLEPWINLIKHFPQNLFFDEFFFHRYKLKFSPDKIDTMIVQAVSLLDDLDKELNNYIMRCREWYGWHFPEMGKVVTDNLAYVRTVQKMGMRVNAASTDLSEILPEEVEVAVKVNADLYLPLDLKGQRFIIPCFHYCLLTLLLQTP